MVERIACFLTCGYTEAGAMQSFLKKINNKYEYRQYLPNKTKKKKGTPKTIHPKFSGLTGEGLLKKVYEIIEKHREELLSCRAIILEDDLDGRFHGMTEEQISQYKEEIAHTIREKLGGNLPVFILYASPEAESWFIADWKNGFEYLYKDSNVVTDVENRAKAFFTHHLRKYIGKDILKEYEDDIENYGFFNGEYFKLSDKLIDGIQTDIKEYIKAIEGANKEYVNQIVVSRDIFYSKKLHGDRMLRNIKPEILADKCRRYFSSVYYELHNLE